ncbi:uncharacterized protein BKCO1_4600043 [Diplodia corticola]|uniref:Dna repair protein swi5 n=1 Tax=Diplodia corticola TaxID=236234 RepID=A0A1J9QRN1_9PEZI|nr:uncharacterized protein BKCO1_4600043 [Diplodia corticola]OJD31606.1 hypothetical protein BKCO1_4600043 [Diplodia corticola]
MDASRNKKPRASMASSPSRNALRDHRDADPMERTGAGGATEPPMHPHADKRLPNAQARTAALQATLADLTARRNDVVKEFAAVPSVAEKLPLSCTAAANSAASSAPDTDAEKDAAVRVAKAIIQQQIRRLNDYNEMRDVGQELMGIIAESRGVRIKEIQDEFGISTND